MNHLTLLKRSSPYIPRQTLALSILLTPALWLGAASPAMAQFNLAQSPPVATSQAPAPNVILTVDDSGSMDERVGGRGSVRKIVALQNALQAQFGQGTSKGRVADGSIRLGWQIMHDKGLNTRTGTDKVSQASLTPGAINSVKPFTGAHRTSFNAFVSSLASDGGGKTPSHKMMTNLRNYMLTATGVNSPFAADPGTTELPILACRRTYHIFMTDGYWNEETAAGTGYIGNYDGGQVATDTTTGTTQAAWSHSATVANALPDGTVYDITSDQTRVYRDAYGFREFNLSDGIGSTNGTFKGTLADWALANWATDFSTAPNIVTPQLRVTGNETVTSGASSTVLAPYWNPKNNPMTWQGVVQHSIGFGNDAVSWSGAPTWDSTTDDNYGGGYGSLVNGLDSWQGIMSSTAQTRRSSDLWHMALNGRGKFYPARDAAALETAFSEILSSIVAENARPLTGIAASTSNLRADSFAYVGGYYTANWSGSLKAYALSKEGILSSTATWSAGDILDALDTTGLSNRKIATYQGSAAVDFTETGLGDTELTTLGGGTLATGQLRLAYLRGSRVGEGSTMRARGSVLGDIVNSQPWYMRGVPNAGLGYLGGYKDFITAKKTRPSVVFIGANDGMLHGFHADTGSELLAYVPAGVMPKLAAYTQTSYTHQYMVDGQPFTADANFGTSTTPSWKTVAVGTLGNGGKGFFLLDVSSPSAFTKADVLADYTGSTDADLGHMNQAPVKNASTGLSEQVVQTNDGKWSLVMGNGVNSTNARPVLLVQTLTTAGLASGLTKVVAGDATSAADTGNGNGLSAPRLIDLDGNGTMDLAYAGDMKGNLWRFDMTSATPSSWTAKKIYTATDSSTTPKTQPITAAPNWNVHPKGGLMLLVGTGKNIESTDPNNVDTQSMYGIWDVSARFKSTNTLQTPTAFSGRSKLVQQTQGTTASTATGQTTYTMSTNDVTYLSTLDADTNMLTADTDSKLGWYLDIPKAGHRVISNPAVYDRNYMRIQTLLPARTTATTQETCDTGPRSSDEALLYVLDIFSGKPAPTTVFGQLSPANTGALELPNGPTIISLPKGDKDLLVTPVPGGAGGECTGTDCTTCTGSACTPTPVSLSRFWPNLIPSASYTEY